MKPTILGIAILLIVIPIGALAQNFDTRMNALLSEIDATEIQYKMIQLAANTNGTLNIYQAHRAAIIFFKNEKNQRTGLTEYLAAEFAKRLRSEPTTDLILPGQIAPILQNQFDLAKFEWPRECPAAASRLAVAALIRGRVLADANKIQLAIDIFRADDQSLVTHTILFPGTAGLTRLNQLVLQESPLPKTEVSAGPTPVPAPGPVTPEVQPVAGPVAQSVAMPTTVEIAVRNLADKLAVGLGAEGQIKIGVLEFLDLQGRCSQLGKFIAEDLTTAFFETRKFGLVERGLLQQVSREHVLIQTGMIDPARAQEIGKLVGADAIITGSLSDLGNEIKANARLIGVGEGAVLAVAGASIAKTENIRQMFQAILWSPETKTPTQPEPAPVTTGSGFFEDFQNVAEGMLPAGWFGGEKLLVKSDGRQKFVTDFEWQDTHKVLIDNLSFPENFEFTVYFQFGRQADHTRFVALLGSLTLKIDVFGWYSLNQTRIDKRTDWRNKLVKAVLTRSGPIFKLFINGEEVLMIRDTDYKLPQAISLEFQMMSGFRLVQVGVE